MLNILLGQLLPVMEGIAAYDEEIEHLFVQHPDSLIFASLPRAGKRLAPRLLAEWGDDHARYVDAASVQALAGTAPVTRQSGNYCTAHCRLSCLKPLRNALHQFAWQSTQCEEWASASYKKKRAEGKTHTVAVRSLAHIWARILYAMWVKRESYQSTVFMTARQAHQRAA